ncbi:MAG: hypothetical protein A2428_06475 [Bdellovibrionales bacterium RIFOXYC1_FULL_54_43]|nr:MAG: hypothetical protein A2428_06475 [Bdellovibrionales bacterium RIFOXYC1_FULL_54_43]OFZ85125.1 MAG: hypothetical protein A2603_07270 [Bdellovibrionales bacterium RIFOXYD1_FULL_55_31]
MTKLNATFHRMAIVVAFAAILSATACSKQQKPEEAAVPTAPAADENIATGDSDSGKALGLQTVHFPYDSFILDNEAKAALKANADILKDKSSAKIQLEGHCDQRGGIQYNIALGEKRANATKKYLEDLGIAGDRITTISFGKERPIDPGMTEEAHAKNRRVNFVVTSR